MKYGSITTGIIADGLVLNIDAANRASTIPSTSTTKTFNTVDTSISGSIITDGTWGAGPPSTFDFDGTDGYINLSSGLADIFGSSYSGGFTLNMWFKKGNNSRLFSIETTSNNAERGPIFMEYQSNKIRFQINGTTSDNFYYILDAPITNNTNFRCFTLVMSPNSSGALDLKGYIDSIESSATPFGTQPSAINFQRNIYIGIVSPTYNYSQLYMNGNLGPTQIYNRALSSNEVLHNYNALKGRFGL